jgi:hypothetical protein
LLSLQVLANGVELTAASNLLGIFGNELFDDAVDPLLEKAQLVLDFGVTFVDLGGLGWALN